MKPTKTSVLSPLKAIRAKCLDCCCGQVIEICDCPVSDCPLHPYRFGRGPSRTVSAEVRSLRAKNMKLIRQDRNMN